MWPNCIVVEVAKTTYFEPGIELHVHTVGQVATATVGSLPASEGALRLDVGDELVLARSADARDVHGDAARVSCTLPEVVDHARANDRVWFDDGKIGAVVAECGADGLRLRITDAPPGGARLRGGKLINLPDTELPIAA